MINTIDDFLLAGLSVVPVDQNKLPLGRWKHLQQHQMSSDEAATIFDHAHGVAVVCGKVSGGLEIIDFDAHNNDIQQIYDTWIADDGVNTIIHRNKCYIERTPRGGIHIAYLYECEGSRDGNKKIANWENGESMIETRGEGGYCITAPTPNYSTISGSLFDLPTISKEERDYLLNVAAKLNRKITPETQQQQVAQGHHYTDPVSWYNWHKAAHAKNLLRDAGWVMVETSQTGEEMWRRPGKDDGISATWGHKYNALYVFTSSAENFENETYYTPFQILVKLNFNNNYLDAIRWVESKYNLASDDIPYIRVGADYYKKITKVDRYGITRIELKAWKKDEIRQDNNKKDYLRSIPKYDDFVIKPSNTEHCPVVNNCYNLYRPVAHIPAAGDWRWTKVLLQHIFGEQYDLGIRYMQILYLHPDKMMPILVLVSRERQTGKTTFLNWLNMIFGSNVANISPEDLVSGFNYTYATANIIAVEETLIEKSITVEKLKALATMKHITVNQKFVSQFKIPFFGKIILTSNNEDKFAKIDEDEIRFFVRKVGIPSTHNHNIEADLLKEIPAFLQHLTQLPSVDFSVDRSGFTPAELSNNSLIRVKQESKPGLFKNLYELFADFFANNPQQQIKAAPIDIKNKWFTNNNQVDLQYIKKILVDDFRLAPSHKLVRYEPFADGVQRVGTPYTFQRDMFDLPPNDNNDDAEIPF